MHPNNINHAISHPCPIRVQPPSRDTTKLKPRESDVTILRLRRSRLPGRMQSDLASIPQPHIADATNYWSMHEHLTLFLAIYTAQHGDGTPMRTSDDSSDRAGQVRSMQRHHSLPCTAADIKGRR
jgi:hypothetical protein